MATYQIRPFYALMGVVGIICKLAYVTCDEFLTMQIFEYGSQTAAMVNHVCPAVELLGSKRAADHVWCSILCQQESSCQSFFFDRVALDCVLCSEQYHDTSSLDSRDGMEYYRMVLPNWDPWNMWSACSKTCGVGTKTRTRTCSLDSRVPCTFTTETVNCNTFSCAPIARTCTEWAARGLEESGTAQIDPLATGPVEVVCDLTIEPDKAWTVIGHNYEQRTYVHGFEAHYSYSISIAYDVGLEAAIKVADLSTECKQFLKWEFYHQNFQDSSCWMNRHGNRSTYFTGSPPPGKYCACGEAGTCSIPNLECECNRNDFAWRVDEGFVTTNEDLPVKGMRAGDTGIRPPEA